MAQNMLGPESVSAFMFRDSAFRLPIFQRFSSVQVIKCCRHTQPRDSTGCRHTALTNACNCCLRRSIKCSSYRPNKGKQLTTKQLKTHFYSIFFIQLLFLLCAKLYYSKS